MQVNVKELTGVLHLKLVFMTVLVLQSFLAVFFKCKCDRCFEPLLQLPVPVLLQVCCVNHSRFQVNSQCEPLVQLPA